MDCLQKEINGLDAYNKRTNHPWESIAEKCNYVQTPEEGANAYGFYIMKISYMFDGKMYVDKLKPKDVSAFFLLFSSFIRGY